MERPQPRSSWFLGDLNDPWVAAIAEALPSGAERVACPADLPERWPAELEQSAVVVIHRSVLTVTDAERLQRLAERPAGARPKLVLCVGAHARYRELERWAGWVDAILPEATAPETVGRHLRLEPDPARLGAPRGSVTLVCALGELRWALAEACEEAGYAVVAADQWPAEPAGGLAVWGVPVLDDDWPVVLSQQARRRRVVALLGFADRVSVSLAKAQGAAACLDLPGEPADLVFVLDRLAAAEALNRAQPKTAAGPARSYPGPHATKRAKASTSGRGDSMAGPAVGA